MFAVSDTGTGDDDGGERMTLGLAAVAGIVKQSGGTMGIETRPEGGTVVRVYLPRAEEAALAAPLARAQSA
jgi:K+-sensing histidine kinase KdpD